MKNMLKNYGIGALACMIFGIALIIRPSLLTDTLNYLFGAIIIVWGTVGIVKYFIRTTETNVFSLVGSIAILLLGCFILANRNLLETLVMVSVGLYLLSSGIPKVIYSVRMKNAGYEDWKMPLITSCLTVTLGVFIIASPALLHGVMRVVGGILAVSGGLHFVSGFSVSKFTSELNERANEKAVDHKGRKADVPNGEVIDVDDYDVK